MTLNKLTTILGLVIIMAASISVFTHDRSWIEVAAIIPSASVLIFVHNEKAVKALKAIKDE